MNSSACDMQDEENLREGLRYARDVLGELRSSELNPQKYYEMYMQVFDELVTLRVSTIARTWHPVSVHLNAKFYMEACKDGFQY